MDKQKNYLNLKKLSQSAGAELFGVADIRQIKNEFLLKEDLQAKFNYAVALGVRLSASILADIENTPTKLYFHHYRTVNNFLDQIALRVSSHIQQNGYLALSIPASQIIDWQKQKAHLSHKKIGYLAGLGWMGRNNLLVNEKLGSQFRLVSVLTDLPLKIDRPIQKDCGECISCVKICPAGAIKKDYLSFDYMKCFEKLKEFQSQRLVDQYICGICVNACKGQIRI